MRFTNDKLMSAINKIQDDDGFAERLGANLADALYLKRDKEHKDRWLTEWGTKTNIGLARTIIRIIEDEG